jgi:uncharacterized RDD family membrane protein YckC
MAHTAQDVPSIRRRVASMLYDGLLLLGVLSCGLVLPHVMIGFVAGFAFSGIWLWLHMFILVGTYFIWFWHYSGQTLAMQTWKIKVCAVDGMRPTLTALALRYLFSLPGVLFLGIGIIWALVDRERQFLHDRLAGTRICFANDAPPTTAMTHLPTKKQR